MSASLAVLFMATAAKIKYACAKYRKSLMGNLRYWGIKFKTI